MDSNAVSFHPFIAVSRSKLQQPPTSMIDDCLHNATMTVANTRPSRPPTSLNVLLSVSKKDINGDGVFVKFSVSIDHFAC